MNDWYLQHSFYAGHREWRCKGSNITYVEMTQCSFFLLYFSLHNYNYKSYKEYFTHKDMFVHEVSTFRNLF